MSTNTDKSHQTHQNDTNRNKALITIVEIIKTLVEKYPEYQLSFDKWREIMDSKDAVNNRITIIDFIGRCIGANTLFNIFHTEPTLLYKLWKNIFKCMPNNDVEIDQSVFKNELILFTYIYWCHTDLYSNINIETAIMCRNAAAIANCHDFPDRLSRMKYSVIIGHMICNGVISVNPSIQQIEDYIKFNNVNIDVITSEHIANVLQHPDKNILKLIEYKINLLFVKKQCNKEITTID